MSFREIRNFTECMRTLGFPRLIAVDSFRNPNFDLVADILLWLVKRYDPTLDIPDDVSTETDRVFFIKSIAQHMATKAHIKLNTRKLYGADGYAVKELLKIAAVLNEALNSKGVRDEPGGLAMSAHDDLDIPQLDIASKLVNLKTCRTLASEITLRGADLHDLLGKEIELREIRMNTISRPLELDAIESAVKGSISKLAEQVLATRHALDNLSSDESNLEAKIEKKKQELERHEKRLRSLQSVRPAYMDEYERLEVELQRQYVLFMEKYRNLTYVEQQLEEHNRAEQDKFEETESTLKKMQTRLREEELRLLRNSDDDVGDDVGDGEEDDEDFDNAAGRGNSRPQGAAGKRVTGSMEGGSDSDSDESGKTVGSEEENISIGSGDSGSMLGDEEVGVGGEDGSENEDEVEVDEDDVDDDEGEEDDDDGGDDDDEGVDDDDDIPVSRSNGNGNHRQQQQARGAAGSKTGAGASNNHRRVSDADDDGDYGSNGSDNDF